MMMMVTTTISHKQIRNKNWSLIKGRRGGWWHSHNVVNKRAHAYAGLSKHNQVVHAKEVTTAYCYIISSTGARFCIQSAHEYDER